MARDGNGSYSLPEAAFVYDTVIDESAVNSNFSDIASALTASIAKDGQTVPSANLPMGTYKHTGVGNASARDQYAAMGQVQDGAGIWCGTAGGTADAITLTPSPAIPAYAAGQRFEFKSGAASNTGAVTFAISGLSTIAGQVNGAACSGGEVAANQWYRIVLSDASTAQIEKIGSATGGGDVTGPASSTADALVLFNGTGGKTIKDSTYTITAAGAALLDDANAAAQRTTLGLGTAATVNTGTSAGNAVVLDGSAKLPAVDGSQLTGISAGKLVLIQAQSASSSTSIDFTTGISSTYDLYMLVYNNVVPATDNTSLYLRVSEDAGSTWKSGASDYVYGNKYFSVAATEGIVGSAGAAQILVNGQNLGNATGDTGSGVLWIQSPATTTRSKLIQGNTTTRKSTGQIGNVLTAAYIGTNNAITGIRMLMSSGNITSGTFALYGVAKS